MIQKFILFLLFNAIAYTSQAQKVIDKMVKQTCDCFETIDIKANPKYIDSAFAACFSEALIGNRRELSKKYKMEFGEELMDKIQPVFVKELLSRCDKALQIGMIMSQSKELQEKDSATLAKKKIVLDPNAVVTSQQCLALQLGTFRYIKEGVLDTTKILVFTKDKILDYDDKGKLITTSELVWKSECSYVSTIVKTESEEMKMFAKEKTKLDATIVQIDGDIITYNVKVFGVETLFQLKKIK